MVVGCKKPSLFFWFIFVKWTCVLFFLVVVLNPSAELCSMGTVITLVLLKKDNKAVKCFQYLPSRGRSRSSCFLLEEETVPHPVVNLPLLFNAHVQSCAAAPLALHPQWRLKTLFLIHPTRMGTTKKE